MNQSFAIASPPAAQVSSTAPLLLHVFSTFAVGGPQRRFAALANHFGGKFRHVVIALDRRTDAKALLDPAINCEVRLPDFARRNPISDIAAARKQIRRVRPDLLVTYNWGAMEWGAANLVDPVRHIHIEDGFGPEEAHRQLRRRVLFRRFVLNRHSTLVLPSRTLVALATNTWRIDPSHIVFLPNGIPCARFQAAAGAQMAFPGAGPIVGTVAALRREKALGRLLEAFSLVNLRRSARLVIVGDGPERAALEHTARERGLENSVIFTGALDRPEFALASFDIFALSSDTEQMPLSVLEAMAAGLPVVSTDVGDVKHMLAGENQPFVVSREVGALAAALCRLLDDANLRRALGAANRAHAAIDFDESRMFAAYERLFSA
jgi:glycosyltransferase involved in cell wall biosynthesis